MLKQITQKQLYKLYCIFGLAGLSIFLLTGTYYVVIVERTGSPELDLLPLLLVMTFLGFTHTFSLKQVTVLSKFQSSDNKNNKYFWMWGIVSVLYYVVSWNLVGYLVFSHLVFFGTHFIDLLLKMNKNGELRLHGDIHEEQKPEQV